MSVRSPTLQISAYEAIRQALVAGRFKPGEAISVRLLCETLKLRTMPAREGVQRLIAEHALEFSPNKTVRVPVHSFAEFTQLLEICGQLEALAMRKAAGLRTTADIANAKRNLAEFRAAVRQRDARLVLKTNADFWFCLYAMSKSEPLCDLIGSTWLRIGPVLQLPYRHDAGIAVGQPLSFNDANHDRRLTALVAAIEQGEARRAESITRKFVEQVLHWFRRNSGSFRLE
jgi:DNA-binding GntR family transcriptional regulator